LMTMAAPSNKTNISKKLDFLFIIKIFEIKILPYS
jgi:hypothetical protein